MTRPSNFQSVAPEAWITFAAIEQRAANTVDESVSVPMRHAIASILGSPLPTAGAVATADPRATACVEFTEQFVVDVAGITDAQRQAMFVAMGADAFTFVQTLFVADVFARAHIAVERLFGESIAGGVSTDSTGELWPLLEQFMQQVALLGALDPVTTELVRLRGARTHNCRLCQSRRSVKAIDAAGGDEIFNTVDRVDGDNLTERQLLALRLTDALVTQPRTIDAELTAAVHEHFEVAEIVEIVLDVVRNAANKIAVAFGADAPIVTEGVEFYDIDANGDVFADVDMALVRATVSTAG